MSNPTNPSDPFALARQDDADLFEAIAEFRRLIAAANAAGDEKETAHLCAEARPWRDLIEECKPATMDGAIESLALAEEIDDYAFSRKAAIEGLRAIRDRMPAAFR